MRIRVVIFCLISIHFLHAQKVEWVYSTDTNRWQKSKTAKLEKRQIATIVDIDVTNKKSQCIEGIGGTFNELGWEALMSLPEKEREQILDDLFSLDGANFNYNRMPIGASDYGMSFYSLNDVVDDLKMVNFNIDRDRYILLQYIKSAQKVRPDMKIWASPWSPPGWMKITNHYACSADADYNGMCERKVVDVPFTAFKMQRGYLEAYALYFTKFIRAYEREGVKVDVIHVQNEPCSSHKFPGCNWRSEDLTYFISEYLGPKFESENIDTEIYFGTINNDDLNYPRAALNDPKASKYIKGVGFQWEGKRAIGAIHKEYPHLKLMQTESECGGHSNDWEAAEYTWSLINQYIKNGANVYTYWNMVLDETGLSTWGWAQNSLISVDKSTKAVVYHPEFYIMKHVSHFVQPGAYRLETNGGDDHLAFVNPDGKTIVVFVNKENSGRTLKIGINGYVLDIEAKARSFNTIVL